MLFEKLQSFLKFETIFQLKKIMDIGPCYMKYLRYFL